MYYKHLKDQNILVYYVVQIAEFKKSLSTSKKTQFFFCSKYVT